MGNKMKKWISFGVQLLIAALVAVVLYNSFVDDLDPTKFEHQRYVAVKEAWSLYCWSNALFIPGVMWLGVGGLMWIATTGFFDIFSYAFSSLLVLFTPLKNPKDHKRFYEYKLDKEERRKGKPVSWSVLIVGLILIIAAFSCNAAYNNVMDPYLESPEYQQIRQEITDMSQGGGTDADQDQQGITH